MSSTKRGRSLAEVMSPIEDELGATAGPASAMVAEGSEDSTVSAADAGEGRAGHTAADAPAMTIVPVNVLVAPEDRRRLRQLSLDTNLSLQKLGHEAWNLLLQKRGLPPLKPVSANVPSGRATGRTRS